MLCDYIFTSSLRLVKNLKTLSNSISYCAMTKVLFFFKTCEIHAKKQNLL